MLELYVSQADWSTAAAPYLDENVCADRSTSWAGDLQVVNSGYKLAAVHYFQTLMLFGLLWCYL